MPTLEAEQLEIPEMPERSPLGQACKKFLDIKEKIKDLDEDAKEAAKEIMGKMGEETKTSIRFNGWEFEMETPDIKLVCHAIKGKSEASRKAA